MSKIDNPHVARCYTVDEFNGIPFLVMEYIDGETLQEFAKRTEPTIDESLRLVRKIAIGLSEVHRAGFLHLDLNLAM